MQDGILNHLSLHKNLHALDHDLPRNIEDCMNISEKDDVFNFTLKLEAAVSSVTLLTMHHTARRRTPESQFYYSALGDFGEERFLICYSLNFIYTVLMMMIMIMMMMMIMMMIIIIII